MFPVSGIMSFKIHSYNLNHLPLSIHVLAEASLGRFLPDGGHQKAAAVRSWLLRARWEESFCRHSMLSPSFSKCWGKTTFPLACLMQPGSDFLLSAPSTLPLTHTPAWLEHWFLFCGPGLPPLPPHLPQGDLATTPLAQIRPCAFLPSLRLSSNTRSCWTYCSTLFLLSHPPGSVLFPRDTSYIIALGIAC